MIETLLYRAIIIVLFVVIAYTQLEKRNLEREVRGEDNLNSFLNSVWFKIILIFLTSFITSWLCYIGFNYLLNNLTTEQLKVVVDIVVGGLVLGFIGVILFMWEL